MTYENEVARLVLTCERMPRGDMEEDGVLAAVGYAISTALQELNDALPPGWKVVER